MKVSLTTGDINLYSAPFGQGTGPIHYGQLHCGGQESRLTECTRGFPHGCNHEHDAGVRCLDIQRGRYLVSVLSCHVSKR
jgi:hypothetical protein